MNYRLNVWHKPSTRKAISFSVWFSLASCSWQLIVGFGESNLEKVWNVALPGTLRCYLVVVQIGVSDRETSHSWLDKYPNIQSLHKTSPNFVALKGSWQMNDISGTCCYHSKQHISQDLLGFDVRNWKRLWEIKLNAHRRRKREANFSESVFAMCPIPAGICSLN